MRQRSITTSVLLWLLRVAVFLAIAYGLGFLIGYFTGLSGPMIGLGVGAAFFGYMVWRDKRRTTSVAG